MAPPAWLRQCRVCASIRSLATRTPWRARESASWSPPLAPRATDLLVPLPISCCLPFAGGARHALAAYTAADTPFCGDGWKGAEAEFAATDHTGDTHAKAMSKKPFVKR
jgi:hypothetical protein